MPYSESQELPLITVGIVVFNREWIIKQMLSSLKQQTYPHDKIFVVLVDGESKDKTVQVAKEFLDSSDFSGYEVIVKDTNIPEARNLCIQNMKGDYLLFWDSDIIMEPTAIAKLLETLKTQSADMASACVNEVMVNSTDELEKQWMVWAKKYPRRETIQILDGARLGNILISKKVVSQICFDPAFPSHEDQDFTGRAIGFGFKIIEVQNVIGFDVNWTKQRYSDIYAFDMPIKKQLRGIRNRGKVEAFNLIVGSVSPAKAVAGFFWRNKRLLFSLGYVPAVILTIAGVLLQNLVLALVFPVYFLLYAASQIARKGFFRGFSMAAGSLVAGVPVNYALLYYCVKMIFKKPKNPSTA
jgi:glycosyltransferase involved in cell wall biosynthesis